MNTYWKILSLHRTKTLQAIDTILFYGEKAHSHILQSAAGRKQPGGPYQYKDVVLPV